MTAALGILADDLTGAADSAVPFAARGLRAVVALPGHLGWPDNVDVIALDTDSRALPPGEAAERVRAAVELLQLRRVSRWFKKVDSTLRGNVAAELAAVLKAGHFSLAVLAPSFPANERRVRDGTLLVGPLASPTSTTDIRALLASQDQALVTSVGLPVVERGPNALATSLRELSASEPTVAIVDAVDDGHLLNIAQAAQLLDRPCLLAGSGGLSAAMAVLEPLEPRQGVYEELPVKRVMVLVGSLNPHTRAQLEFARLVLAPLDLYAPIWVLSTRHVPGSKGWEGILTVARKALERRGVILLATATTGAGPERLGGDRAPVEALAALAATLLRTTEGVGVVASGGDTIAALCRELGGGLLEVRREILPGMPRARLLDGEQPGLPIVTKAGGFGPVHALARAVRSLWGET